ncbi:MAG: DUF3037 domain-containing protein [Pseudomonadota bacterium]
MKKTPCLYAIVRFTPFVETGEFANVGILLMAPAQGHFAFRLLNKKYGRVTSFFEELDTQVYKTTIKHLRDELDRAGALLAQHVFETPYTAGQAEFARALFKEIVRPREAVIKFSDPRTVMADDLPTALDELFEHYVQRSFVTPDTGEKLLERAVKQWFLQTRLTERFKPESVGNEDYHVPFPFVEQRDHHPLKAIKPLHLAQEQPTKIIEHGGQWIMRIKQLRKRGLLPEHVLFAVQGPETDDARERAFEDIVDELQGEHVLVMPYANKEGILRFAGSAH